MNRERVDFLIELGDFKDQDEKPAPTTTLAYLRAIEGVFRGFEGPRYHVLGNHDMDSISKAQFQAAVSNTGIPPEQTWYSFERGGFHFTVLDANFRRDGAPYDSGNFDWRDTNISEEQLSWLRKDLRAAQAPAVVFVHQRLDVGGNEPSIGNRLEVRQILEESGKAPLVMQGHVHAGAYQQIGGIHYYTQVASVEGTQEGDATCTIVALHPGAIEITGYARAVSRRL
jgi:alkaline phosphatase